MISDLYIKLLRFLFPEKPSPEELKERREEARAAYLNACIRRDTRGIYAAHKPLVDATNACLRASQSRPSRVSKSVRSGS